MSDKVFTWLEYSESELRKSAQSDVAGQQFIKMLKWLRVVLLQDAAMILATDTPLSRNRLFNEGLFKSKDFKAYAKSVRENVNSAPEPRLLQLELALPIVSGTMTNVLSNQAQGFD